MEELEGAGILLVLARNDRQVGERIRDARVVRPESFFEGLQRTLGQRLGVIVVVQPDVDARQVVDHRAHDEVVGLEDLVANRQGALQLRQRAFVVFAKDVQQGQRHQVDDDARVAGAERRGRDRERVPDQGFGPGIVVHVDVVRRHRRQQEGGLGILAAEHRFVDHECSLEELLGGGVVAQRPLQICEAGEQEADVGTVRLGGLPGRHRARGQLLSLVVASGVVRGKRGGTELVRFE